MQSFNKLDKIIRKNIVGKGENAGYQYFLICPHTLSKKNCTIWATLKLLFVNAINFDDAGKGLTRSLLKKKKKCRTPEIRAKTLDLTKPPPPSNFQKLCKMLHL